MSVVVHRIFKHVCRDLIVVKHCHLKCTSNHCEASA